MKDRGRVTQRLVVSALLAGLVAACGLPLVGTRLDARPHGADVALPPRPTDAECAERIRSDHATAASIRAVMGVDGVDDTIDAAAKAANDATADTSRHGIPLTQAELALVERSPGAVDGTIGLAGLVAAHPDTLNTVWLDGDTLTMSVLRPDAAVLQLARCLDRGDMAGRVRYVSAGIPAAELSALGDRIHGDREALAREGIEVTVVSSDPRTETVRVGVGDVVEGTARRLIERYGTVVVVIESAGPQPALRPSHGPPGPGG